MRIRQILGVLRLARPAGMGVSKAAACAKGRGALSRALTNLFTFCEATIKSAAAFTFSSFFKQIYLNHANLAALAKSGSTHALRLRRYR